MIIQLADRQLDPPVFLAPLAGITDLPFRELVASFGAGKMSPQAVTGLYSQLSWHQKVRQVPTVGPTHGN
ncbi:MAG: hypothetical protein ACLFRU_06890, partial [Paracoccaceae bacterium]